jgi:hypothetical protein
MHFQAAGMAGLVATLASVGAPPAPAQAVIGPHLTVHLVNEANASPRVVKTAQASVGGIYEAIGVVVTWVDLSPGDRQVFILKLVLDARAERLKAAPDSLGVALTSGNGHGRIAYVFYDRIQVASRRNRLDVSAVLGAAISHELAHLVLPSVSHTARGLMGADWSRADLLSADRRGLRFTAQQATRIRAQLESRGRTDVASAPKK